jgi:hypothetical protein
LLEGRMLDIQFTNARQSLCLVSPAKTALLRLIGIRPAQSRLSLARESSYSLSP